LGKAYTFLSMSLTSSAYLKSLLHAAKYPSSPVFGLLIGIKTKGTRSWLITDSVPLFHTHVLAPMLELAFLQVEEYCRCMSLRDHKKFRILGCYVANERMTDLDMNVMTRRVALRINTVTSGRAVVLMIDNTKIAKPVNALRTMLCAEKHWRLAQDSEEYSPPKRVYTELPELIRKDRERGINDFEEHLANPSKDYFNVGFLPEGEDDLGLIASAQVDVDDDEVEEKSDEEEADDEPLQPQPTVAATVPAATPSTSNSAKPKPTVLGTEDDID